MRTKVLEMLLVVVSFEKCFDGREKIKIVDGREGEM